MRPLVGVSSIICITDMNPTDGLSGICFVRVIGVMAGEWDQDGAVFDQVCEFFGEVYPRIGRWH